LATFFISDLHLTAERPQSTQAFLHFLQHEVAQAQALYILGDLFEAWIGDDSVPPGMAAVMDGLRDLTQSGVPVYVMVGNRDFLLGETFAAATGCTLLPDPSIVDLYGTPTLLMHGDTLCTDDVEYQQIRAHIRTPQWCKDFLAKTIEERIALAKQARAQSQASTSEKDETIMDVNAQAVAEAFRQHGVTQLIHGHTHRPAIHALYNNGKSAKRIVLGDWYEQSSILRCDEGGCAFVDSKNWE
jgi:UDP-2,3-diacylglucosamine hydrolase